MRLRWALILAACAVGGLPVTAGGATTLRPHEPVVLTGIDTPSWLGEDPGRIVAFRWDGAWTQIPVQVDERAVVDFGTIYGGAPMGQSILTYVDAGTFTGADPDPLLDADDEIVFLAREAGPRSPGAAPPAGVVAGSGLEVSILDPLTSETGWVTLFLTDGSLDPAANASPISYDVVFLRGPYLTTYRTDQGPNPEDTLLTAPAYRVHFSDRWIRNLTAVTAGSATGVDVLDRHKFQFEPGNCGRTERTFSDGEGAFIVNRVGPVRALRGYVGANSGPTTHRIHAFYEEREAIFSSSRVHAIPGVMDYFDYLPAAAGMTYADDLNPAGVVVDGSPDTIAGGEFTWQMLTGAPGTIVHVYQVHTDIPSFDYTTHYSDNVSPPTNQCTGDGFEYGASGFWEDDPVPNTDPGLGAHFVLDSTRTIRYAPPGQTAAFAQAFADEIANPLVATVVPPGDCPDADADGYVVCDGICSTPSGTSCGDCDDQDPDVNPAGTEACNGADDDCDGTVDEGNPGGGTSCSTGRPGVCGPGTLECAGGSLECVADAAAPETCNGLDDDCDGTVDEGNPGGGAGCGTGDPGVCAAGTLTCDAGSFVCRADASPQPESCNGADDDCDGTVDEGNPGGGGACSTGQPGICAPGMLACAGGSLQCLAIETPRAETCDGTDEDCNGSVDDPTGLDPDGDAVDSGCDNCPAAPNPGQEDSDGDGTGDACEPEIVITAPAEGDTLDCRSGAPPPTLVWTAGPNDRFRAQISWKPNFRKKVSSGRRWLETASWTVPAKKWKKACAKADPFLWLRVRGQDRDVGKKSPDRKASSPAVQVGTQQ